MDILVVQPSISIVNNMVLKIKKVQQRPFLAGMKEGTPVKDSLKEEGGSSKTEMRVSYGP